MEKILNRSFMATQACCAIFSLKKQAILPFIRNVAKHTSKYRMQWLYLENLPGYCTISQCMALFFAMPLVQAVKNYLALRVVVEQNSIP